MKKAPIFLDSFSGPVISLPKGKRTPDHVLACLAEHPEITHWDYEEVPWLRGILRVLLHDKYIHHGFDRFPWWRFELTEAGKKRLRELGG